MPNSRTEKQPPREEYSNANYPESADEQKQDGPATNRKKTFLEHASDAMNELAELGTLLTQSERRHRQPRTPGHAEDLPDGWTKMTNLAAEAVRTHSFDGKSLQITLAEVVLRSYGNGATINRTLEEGWKQGMAPSMGDGIPTQQEESRLWEFRDRLTLVDTGADRKEAEQVEHASTKRLILDARLAALAVDDPETQLNVLAQSLRQSGLNLGQQTALLVRASEAAVEWAG